MADAIEDEVHFSLYMAREFCRTWSSSWLRWILAPFCFCRLMMRYPAKKPIKIVRWFHSRNKFCGTTRSTAGLSSSCTRSAIADSTGSTCSKIAVRLCSPCAHGHTTVDQAHTSNGVSFSADDWRTRYFQAEVPHFAHANFGPLLVLVAVHGQERVIPQQYLPQTYGVCGVAK